MNAGATTVAEGAPESAQDSSSSLSPSETPEGWQPQEFSMFSYRKKSVVIEAVEWRTGAFKAPKWLAEAIEAGHVTRGEGGVGFIRTLEGDMRADVGDYIIRGVKGELYPCKPDIFEATYDPLPAPPVTRGSDTETNTTS
jgi:hypothetical protein